MSSIATFRDSACIHGLDVGTRRHQQDLAFGDRMAGTHSVAEGAERDRLGGPGAAGGATWRQRARRVTGIVVRFARLFRRSGERGIDETSLSPQSRAIYRQLSAAISDRFVR